VAFLTGTSLSSPIAAGVAALILSVKPDLTVVQIRNIEQSICEKRGSFPYVDGWNKYFGYGRINALKALEFALSSNVYYVDEDALHNPGPGNTLESDPEEDGSLAHPFDSIQEAIDQADDGYKIVLRPGIYKGLGNRDIAFHDKNLTVTGSNPSDPDVMAATVIDCDANEANPHRAFVIGHAVTLKGQTLTNGYTPDSGGAIYCARIDESITISHCAFINNKAKYGGAIYPGYRMTVDECIFKNNDASRFGGVLYQWGPVILTVSNCKFIKNHSDFGGCVFIEGDGLNTNFVNNHFLNNYASIGGGVLYHISAQIKFTEIYSFSTFDRDSEFFQIQVSYILLPPF
jgi:hypothetical protein